MTRVPFAPRFRRWRTRGLALLAAGVLAWSTAAPAQRTAEEYELKAAFLFNFVRFVEWPAGPDDLVLCLLGEDAVTGVLGAFEGRIVQDRLLSVQRAIEASRIDICDVVYVGASEAGRVTKLLAALGPAAGVLTVSDIDGFVDDGGMIEFVREGARIRFDVNVTAARESGVRISSKILRLARRIEGDAR